MNCDEMFELLSASLDGELTDQQEAMVQAHLAQCPDCRALMTELAAIHDGCGAWEVEAPQELTQRILERLPAQETKKPGKLIYWKRWGAMAAAMALIALAAWRMPGMLPGRSADLQLPEQAATGATGPSAPGGGTNQPAVQSDEADFDSLATPASALSPYVDGPGISVNSSFPEPTAETDGLLGTAPQSDAKASKGVFGYSDMVMAAADLEEPLPQPTLKTAAAVPAYDVFTAATADSSTAQENEPSAVEPTMVRSTFARIEGHVDPETDNAVPEFPPATGSGEENISVEPREELYALTVSAPEVYCGVLTLAEGAPVGGYPAQVQEDGQVWYTLPAADLIALCQELDAQGVSYELRLEGADISPTAQQGLLIVTG